MYLPISSGIGLEIRGRLGDNAALMHEKLLKVLFAAVVVLALAFPFLLALEKVSESDTFWHLKTGEWILSHESIPHTDPFSATVYGKPWLDWEWLFQAGIYAVYTWGGFNALVLAKAVIVFLTGLVLFLACRRNEAGSPLAALVVMATFVAARERLEVQPDVVTLLFAAVTVSLLEAARRGKPMWLWGLPLVEVLWVNVHPSFPLGIALAGAYFVGPLPAAGDPRRPVKTRGLQLCVLSLIIAACLVNPFGIDLVRHAIEQIRSLNPSSTIGEWQWTHRLLLTEPNWALTTFWWLFRLNPVVLIGVLAIKRREFPWAHALVVAGMSVLAWRASQFTALYAIVTAPILAHGLAIIRARIAGKQHSDWGEATTRVVAGGTAAFLIFVVVTNRWAVAENRPSKFGLGVDESVVPLRALSMMAKLPAGLNVFNTFLSGGPLLWTKYPQWRPFCDGRANLYGRDFVDHYRQAMSDPADWEAWMREQSVSVAYLQYGAANDRTLLKYLVKSHVWDLLYFDHAACIFVHQSSWAKLRADKQLADYKPVRVTDKNAVLAYAHTLADETASGDAYRRARVVATVGNFLMAIGAVDSAQALFEDAVAINPRPSEAWMNLALITLDEGKTDQALGFTGKLLAMNPRYLYARLLQAQIKATAGDLDGAVADADTLVSDQPHSAQAWLLRAQLAARQGDRPGAIQAIQRTIAEDVADAHLFLFLGELLVAEGRTNEAVVAYNKCLQLWNGPPTARAQIEADLAKLRTPVKK
jgi:tetratricopeptide (TPR) repeat protein